MDTQDVNMDVEVQINKAQAQPGIAELARVYGLYEELMRRSRVYLGGITSRLTQGGTEGG